MKKFTTCLPITRPLLLVFVTSLSLLLSGCGKKDANAAEVRKESAPPQTVPQVVAAQPVAVVAQDTSNDNRRMAAIFTANHADKTLDEKLPALEDLLSSIRSISIPSSCAPTTLH